MPSQIDRQIFYDGKRRRWWYSKRILVVAGVFLVTIFSFGIFGVLVRPELPILNLIKVDPQYKDFSRTPSPSQNPQVVNKNNSTDLQRLETLLEGSPSRVTVSGNQSKPASSKTLGFYVNWDDNSLVSLKQNISKLDELVPEWLHLNGADGSIVVDDQSRQDETISFIKQNRPDLPIVPLVNNFNQQTQDWDKEALTKMLSSQTARTATIQNILTFVQTNNFSGISVDFEAIDDNQQVNLALFMKELYGNFHQRGLEVSQNIPLDDDSYNAKILGQYCDFLILMAYDENSVGDTMQGPIASNDWLVRTLLARFSDLPPQKYVIALGNYGYDWQDQKVEGDSITFQDAMRIAKEAKAEISLDPQSGNPHFEYSQDSILHHVWFLDAVTAFNEIKLTMKNQHPSGYALWYMGSEDPDIWKVFSGQNNLNADGANSLGTMDYGYGIIYVGQGEVLQVSGMPTEGKREITYDEKTGIKGEKITQFPNAYTITRRGGNDPKKIALTFDDGPDKNYTPKILSILKEHNVPATFFVIGLNANLHPDIVRQEFFQGNEVGNHTYTHPNIEKISDQQFKMEMNATERLLEGETGHASLLFRPPYAEDIEPVSPDQIRPILVTSNLGFYTVAMHIDPQDWRSPGVDAIATDVINEAKSGEGNIVLLHDAGGNRDQTIQALPKIIEGLQANGFQLVTVSDLMGLPERGLMPMVSQSEIFNSKINHIMGVVIYGVSSFIYWMFLLGIILGSLRFIFMGILALIQWCYSGKAAYKKYKNKYQPLVCIVIPAFNEEKVICQTINSILASTYPNFKIIVVDDGSEDKTYAKLKEFFGNNPKVVILSKKNGGKAEALNFGIANAEGEIIITLDADTLFRMDTVEKLIRIFVDQRVGAVAGNAKVGNRINLLTRWQALEYITSQNCDRRAFEILNCITVVPGSIGAWRREAIMKAGGFSGETLAEDADLTFAILREGYRIAYEDEAIAFTEAPDNTKDFLKQRFRWMYGTFQTAWKHRDALFRGKNRSLGIIALPNILIFQIFFPLISPLMDLMLIISLGWALWQDHTHLDYSALDTFHKILKYYLFFLYIDFLTALIPFFMERKEQWSLLLWMPFQRFYYRQLMYYVAIKSIFTAIKGRIASWGKIERKATVRVLKKI